MYYPRSSFKLKYDYPEVIQERNSELSNREKAWLNRAMNLAKQSQQRHKHACLIVLGGAIQGYGVNSYRNTPGIVHELDALGVHAEAKALKVTSRTEGAVCYIARVNEAGEPRQSRPCPDCMDALKAAGVKKIVYTVNGSEYL